MIDKTALPKGHSLYVRILTAFIALISITVLPIIIYGYYVDSIIMLSMADNLIGQVTKTAIDKTTDYLMPLSRVVDLSSKIAEAGSLSLHNDKKLEGYTFEVLKSFPQTSMFYFGDERGNFVMARRQADGTIATDVVNRNTSPPIEIWKYRNASFNITNTVKTTAVKYDPRLRPWYAGAKKSKSLYWTDVYIFFHDGKAGITAAYPAVAPNGKFFGVFGLDIHLHEISHFLENLTIGKNGVAFIFNEQNELVAFPDVSRTIKEENGKLRPVHIEEIGIASITTSFRECQQQGKNKCVIETGGKRYIASYQDFPESFRARWKVGVVVPEDDFIGAAKDEMRVSLIICVIILMISISLAMLISRGISKPIKLLTKEANRIKNFHLDDKITIKSYIREIQVMGNAIAAMKSGLQAFRRYVPAELVRQLISTGEEAHLGGHKRELTVFFSDIAGFTTIAEGMAPEELMLHLSEYFDELTQILSEHKGTVDKYIGDGILAFWGAPVPDENHALHACNAALICQARLKDLNRKWASAGKSPFATRIGISSGETVVGNVGSSERINYTVMGDNVNLASRLEGVNKLYGTQIIVSRATYEAVADNFWFRPLDIVAVKGRSEGTTIYELIMKKGEGDSDQVAELCVEFAKGFETYLARDWKVGIKIFQNLTSKFPNDIPADLYLTRCRHYLANPPEADWQGIAYLETK
ncbi:MAG: adenylate/guanylate cyclase domain-containing protein [Desulfobaccales bacterium]